MWPFKPKKKRKEASVDCIGCPYLDLSYGCGFVCDHPLSVDHRTCPVTNVCPCCGRPWGGDGE